MHLPFPYIHQSSQFSLVTFLDLSFSIVIFSIFLYFVILAFGFVYKRVKHRSPDRFLRNLASIPASGIYKNMGREIIATTAVATLIFFWNMIVGGYDDFNQIHHQAIVQSYYLPTIKLPLAPFTLASSSLGLLLGTYVRVCYQSDP
jgi:hypothetical protein